MPSVKEHNEQAAAAYAAVSGRYWIESLKDGRHVLIRPLTERNREREYAFVKRLAANSSHMRLLTPDCAPGTPVPSQYNNKRLAFGALIHDQGTLIDIGISRYAILNPHTCECAVTVADEWRRMHLGHLLMKHLIKAAHKNGFRQMTLTDAASNTAMQHLARAMGFMSCHDPADHTLVTHQLHL